MLGACFVYQNATTPIKEGCIATDAQISRRIHFPKGTSADDVSVPIDLDTSQEPFGKYRRHIESKIEKIDESWVLGWLTVDLAEQEQTEKLKSGIGYMFPFKSTEASTQDKMVKLNDILADLRVKLVVPQTNY